MKKAPGKADREGISLLDLVEIFPDEESARLWFEQAVWGVHRCCGHCGSLDTSEVPNAKPMPYWCKDCRSYFSVRTGTALEKSRLPLRKWAFAIYLELTSLKSISSMKLHRDIKVTQSTAWFMLHRIREAWATDPKGPTFSGPVEVDEAYFGGKRKNMSNAKRKELEGTGRGAVGKTAVVGIKDRDSNQVSAKVVEHTDAQTLIPFVEAHAEPGATVYTDEAKVYGPLPDVFNGYQHESVKHTVSEYVRGQAHTNGVESFWAMLKRAHKGTFHKFSPKHLNRYVQEFAGKHNMREMDTLAQMVAVAARLVGKRLMYVDLTADNGLDSGARS